MLKNILQKTNKVQILKWKVLGHLVFIPFHCLGIADNYNKEKVLTTDKVIVVLVLLKSLKYHC